MTITETQLIAWRASFRDSGGEAKEMPTDDTGFWICAGNWPSGFAGAYKVRCSCCKGFAAIAPKGWALHQVNPAERPIFCTRCFTQITAAVKAMERGQ